MQGRAWLAAAVALSVLYLWLGLLPEMPEPTEGLPDWLVHGAAYLVLAAVVARAAMALGWPPITSALLFVLAHGALLEALQGLTATRMCEWRDLAVDVVGALVGAVVAARWRR